MTAGLDKISVDCFFRATPSKQFLGPQYVDSYLDDTIGSFMGSVTPTRIDGSPSHNARQVVDGPRLVSLPASIR